MAGKEPQVLWWHLVSCALVTDLRGASAWRRASHTPPGGERDRLGRTVIVLPPSLLPSLHPSILHFFWKPIGLPGLEPSRRAHVYLHPQNVCDSSAAAGEQQATCGVCSCAIVRGEIWNSCTQQIEGLYVHPLRWDGRLRFFLFSPFYLFICLSDSKDGTSQSERRRCEPAGESKPPLPLHNTPRLSLLLMYFRGAPLSDLRGGAAASAFQMNAFSILGMLIKMCVFVEERG